MAEKNGHQETHIAATGPREVAWFVALWALGVLTVSLVGWVIKLVL